MCTCGELQKDRKLIIPWRRLRCLVYNTEDGLAVCMVNE